MDGPRRIFAIFLTMAALLGMGTAADAAPRTPQFGAYLAPGSEGAAMVPAWESQIGAPLQRVVDYLPDDDFAHLAYPEWLLRPYGGHHYTLDLAVPLLPNVAGVSLAACATGRYNGTWRTLGEQMVKFGHAAATLRPGWEFNGDWYRWSAKGKEAAYVGCFRQFVTTMRAIPGSRFTFSWCPNLGPGAFAAEKAYPGDAYVDHVAPDIYDFSWAWYPVPAGMSTSDARNRAWEWNYSGDHGLLFWRNFARAHRKPMAFPEWGVAWRADQHAGGDNPVFIDRMMDFINDPANNVAYANYFNARGDDANHHRLAEFPQSLARYRSRVHSSSGTAAVTAGQLSRLSAAQKLTWFRARVALANR